MKKICSLLNYNSNICRMLLLLTLSAFYISISWGQAYTITYTGGTGGSTTPTGVPTGITNTVPYNGVTAGCITSGNGATTSYSTTITAAAGFNFTVTSIGGSAYGSTAGSRVFQIQFVNGANTSLSTATTIATSSSCGTSTALSALSVPAGSQTVTAGNSVTITILRSTGGLTTGGGYSWTKTLTITGVVSAATSAPTVTTPTSASVLYTTATLGGNITNNGNATVTASGVVWSATATNNNPVIGGTGVTNVPTSPLATSGVFTAAATGLPAGTPISYKAYAINSVGTTYTSVATFTTLVTSAPVISSPTFTGVTTSTATLGGNVTGDGGVSITERGVVYSKTTDNNNPLIGGANVTKVTTTGTTGIFTIGITGLIASTGYSFKAYATNSLGTTYTTPVSTFTTANPAATAPLISSPTATAIAQTTATLGGNVTSDGGAALSATGVVWAVNSTNPDPTIGGTGCANIAGSGITGIFTVNAISLPPGTIISYKAYAINSVGITYTTATTFTTLSATAPVVTSPASAAITQTTATLGGNVTSDGANTITSRGVVWAKTSDNGNPTIGGTGTTNITTTGTTGIFTVNASGMIANTSITYRAYATNSIGTTYTTATVFNTLPYPNCTSTSGNIIWNFDNATDGSPSSVPANLSGSLTSPGNAFAINATSASNNSGASGTNNAGMATTTPVTNTYFAFTITPAAGYKVSVTGFKFNSRGTGTAPTIYTITSSLDNYSSILATGTLAANSAWAAYTASFTTVTGALNTPITFRLIGSGATGSSPSAENWRIDDVNLTVTLANTSTLSSSATPAPICTTTAFTYTPASSTPGASFTWTRAAVAGISNSAITTAQSINPNEVLVNTSNQPVNVTYAYTVFANGCNTTPQNVVVAVSPSPSTANAGNDQVLCNSAFATLAANTPATGTGSWSVVSGPSTSISQFNNPASPTAKFTPSGGIEGVYILRWTISSSPCTASTDDVSITKGGYTWAGTVNSVWDNPANWGTCGVPSNGKDITISDVPNYPVLTTDFTTGNITLQGNAKLDINGHTLTLNGAVSGSGTLKGSTSSSLTIGDGVITNTLTFTSGSQILKDLTLNSNSQVEFSNPLHIAGGNTAGTLTVNSGAFLTLDDSLVLESDANGSARVGNTPADASIFGNVTVERYIPADAKRAWRLLSIPTNGDQTIHDAWQEGQAEGTTSLHDYGTVITTSLPNPASLGFDYQTAAGSMLSYNEENNTWDEATTTNAPIATIQGYFLYIRGDRTQTPSVSTGSTTATTLRTTGTLYQGDQPIFIGSGKFGLIGNLYASAIDFTSLTKDAGIDDLFYVWDPKVLNSETSLGGYQTFSAVNNWQPVPGGNGSYLASASNTRIESGQAFFVHASDDATITLTENSKTSGSKDVFRPVGITSGRLKTNLYGVLNSVNNLADGNVAIFNDAYSNMVDHNDARKLPNTQENFGISRSNNSLVIETRKNITTGDTILFDMWNMKQQQYLLEFIPENLNTAGLAAYLQDSYLGTSTPVNLDNGARVLFIIDANAASSAKNRFRIVFKISSPLPVTFTAISASQKNSNVEVEWKVSSENAIKEYIVEHSLDGINFSKVAVITAKSNNNGLVNYSWLDASAITGTNYYRIYSTGENGVVKYSSVVKVTLSSVKAAISIYPNPVKGKKINVQLTNEPPGNYTIRLFTESGQLLYKNKLLHSGGSSTQTVNLPSAISEGLYQLEITTPANKTHTEKLTITN